MLSLLPSFNFFSFFGCHYSHIFLILLDIFHYLSHPNCLDHLRPLRLWGARFLFPSLHSCTKCSTFLMKSSKFTLHFLWALEGINFRIQLLACFEHLAFSLPRPLVLSFYSRQMFISSVWRDQCSCCDGLLTTPNLLIFSFFINVICETSITVSTARKDTTVETLFWTMK